MESNKVQNYKFLCYPTFFYNDSIFIFSHSYIVHFYLPLYNNTCNTILLLMEYFHFSNNLKYLCLLLYLHFLYLKVIHVFQS